MVSTTYHGFWLMYVQVGYFRVSREPLTVPLTQISCNTFFSKSQNVRKAGTLSTIQALYINEESRALSHPDSCTWWTKNVIFVWKLYNQNHLSIVNYRKYWFCGLSSRSILLWMLSKSLMSQLTSYVLAQSPSNKVLSGALFIKEYVVPQVLNSSLFTFHICKWGMWTFSDWTLKNLH